MTELQFIVSAQASGPGIDAAALSRTIQTALEAYKAERGLTKEDDPDYVTGIKVEACLPLPDEEGVYPHVAVIGRVCGDDEDSIYEFENLTADEANEAFTNGILDDSGIPHDDRDKVEVFINHRVAASTALTVF